MGYICISFTVNPPEPGSEILAAVLSEENYESFVFNENGFEAFIPRADYNELFINELKNNFPGIEFSFSTKQIKKQNWNKEWEKQFNPVVIENYAQIRASFHTAPAPPLMDLLIEPKMSFGTGHHATTWLMAKNLFTIDVKGKDVLDVGCGTGILAIIAKKLGAKRVLGIDIDEWSVENSRENRALNGFTRDDIDFIQDTMKSAETSFDIILANINKNILMQDMSRYAKHLFPNGVLFLSGFFETDCPDLIAEAEKLGLRLQKQETKGEWAILSFVK